MLRSSLSIFVILLSPACLCAQDFWSPTSLDGAPTPRHRHSAVWTGQEMIIWGGGVDFDYDGTCNDGARYNPATGAWTLTSVVGAPASRTEWTVVWTGTEMIVWGGAGVNTGGRYHPGEDRWTETPIAGAPTGRTGHTAVWTGKEMIVWGGVDQWVDGGCGAANYNLTTNTGARFDPATGVWTPLSTAGAPGQRAFHAAVWTGTEMIVWGGWDDSYEGVTTGGRYDPETDTWTPMTNAGAPLCSSLNVAVWSGEEMLVWGAKIGVPTGGRYSPATDTWTLLPTEGAPSGRYSHTGVWTGKELIIWGGATGTRENTGARYSVKTDSWTPTSLNGAAEGRMEHTAVWTGSRMIVWGGSNNNGWKLNTGAFYGEDPTPPAAGVVEETHADSGSLSASWTGFGDAESGILDYAYAIGTTPGGTDVKPFTPVGTETSASAENLALAPNTTYYVTVLATNRAGETVTATSDGVRVEKSVSTTPARCSAAAQAPASGPPLAAVAALLLLAFVAVRRRS